MSIPSKLAIVASFALTLAFGVSAKAQTAPNGTNVTANVTTDQNRIQTPQFQNLGCRLGPRPGACRQSSEQRTASGPQRQGSATTQGGGPRPTKRR